MASAGSNTTAKGDRTWLCACTATGVAVDVTLNKWSSVLPWEVVIGLWLIPAVLFVVWFWKVETTASWVKQRFLDHPVSYVLMFLILIPVGYGATGEMIARFKSAKPVVTASVPKAPLEAPIQQTSAPSEPVKTIPLRNLPKPAPLPVQQTTQTGNNHQQNNIGTVDCKGATNCAGVNNGLQGSINGDSELLHTFTITMQIDFPTENKPPDQGARSLGLSCGMALWDRAGRRYRVSTDSFYGDWQRTENIHRYSLVFSPVPEDGLLGQRVDALASMNGLGFDCSSMLSQGKVMSGMKDGDVLVAFVVRANGIEVFTKSVIVPMSIMLATNDNRGYMVPMREEFSASPKSYKDRLAERATGR